MVKRTKRVVHTLSDEEYLLKLTIEPLPKGWFVATCQNLPGLVAQGRSIAQTMEIARDVARRIIESHLEHGDPLPQLVRRRSKNISAIVPVSVTVP